MTLAEMVAALGAPVEVQDCRVKKMSDGTRVVYLPWWKASELADVRTGGRWSTSVTRTWCEDVPHGNRKDGYELVPSAHVTIMVTLLGDDGAISREAVGVDDDPTGQRGTPYERAVGAAVRRALALFGLGRALYDKSVSQAYLDRMPNERQDERRPAPSPRAAAAQGAARPTETAASTAGSAELLSRARRASSYAELAAALGAVESLPVALEDSTLVAAAGILAGGVARVVVSKMPAGGYADRKLAAVGELLDRAAALAAAYGHPADAVEQARAAVGLGQDAKKGGS